MFPFPYHTSFQGGVPNIEVTTQFAERFYLFRFLYKKNGTSDRISYELQQKSNSILN